MLATLLAAISTESAMAMKGGSGRQTAQPGSGQTAGKSPSAINSKLKSIFRVNNNEAVANKALANAKAVKPTFTPEAQAKQTARQAERQQALNTHQNFLTASEAGNIAARKETVKQQVQEILKITPDSPIQAKQQSAQLKSLNRELKMLELQEKSVAEPVVWERDTLTFEPQSPAAKNAAARESALKLQGQKRKTLDMMSNKINNALSSTQKYTTRNAEGQKTVLATNKTGISLKEGNKEAEFTPNEGFELVASRPKREVKTWTDRFDTISNAVSNTVSSKQKYTTRNELGQKVVQVTNKSGAYNKTLLKDGAVRFDFASGLSRTVGPKVKGKQVTVESTPEQTARTFNPQTGKMESTVTQAHERTIETTDNTSLIPGFNNATTKITSPVIENGKIVEGKSVVNTSNSSGKLISSEAFRDVVVDNSGQMISATSQLTNSANNMIGYSSITNGVTSRTTFNKPQSTTQLDQSSTTIVRSEATPKLETIIKNDTNGQLIERVTKPIAAKEALKETANAPAPSATNQTAQPSKSFLSRITNSLFSKSAQAAGNQAPIAPVASGAAPTVATPANVTQASALAPGAPAPTQLSSQATNVTSNQISDASSASGSTNASAPVIEVGQPISRSNSGNSLSRQTSTNIYELTGSEPAPLLSRSNSARQNSNALKAEPTPLVQQENVVETLTPVESASANNARTANGKSGDINLSTLVNLQRLNKHKKARVDAL